VDATTARAVVRQLLNTDRLFGVRSIPVRIEPAPAAGQPTSTVSDWKPGDTTANTGHLRALDLNQVKSCRKCRLCEARTQTVFGQGSATARLVFVGEGPGFEEDKQGLAFVGAAGQLLSRMIIAMGLSREDVFICNVVKCRPPDNRTPQADEILACSPYLHEQLAIIRPEIIVALGAPAAKTLLNTADAIGKLRGRFHEYRGQGELGAGLSIRVMPTYHPAYLLRTPEDKGKVWADLQMVMAELGLKVPQSK
jgi:DNA polymerase